MEIKIELSEEQAETIRKLFEEKDNVCAQIDTADWYDLGELDAQRMSIQESILFYVESDLKEGVNHA
jgi:hypothetical protein